MEREIELLKLLPRKERMEISENIFRKDLTPSELVDIWKSAQSFQGQTSVLGRDRSSRRDKIAKVFRISKDTLSKAKQIVDSGNKELIQEMDKTENITKVYRKLKQKQDEEEIIKKAPQLKLEGKYETIVVDPPWQYDTNVIGRTIPQYAVLSMEQLERMDLNKLADDNCHLYLWSTNAFLPKACQLGAGWGFAYKTILTWIKPSIGIGSYFRNSTEHCLFFIKGQLPLRVKNIGTHFTAKRSKHSEKPEEFYKIAEEVSYEPRLELFARQKRAGWIAWGNL